MLLQLRRATIGALTLLPALAGAQRVERFSLDGRDVAIYNLAGTMHVQGGSGSQVVVEVTRGGADAGRLSIATGEVRGRQALRVRYPSDHIVYPQRNQRGRSTFDIADDDTFGDSSDRGMRRGRRRIEVSSGGSGLEAYADLRVTVPAGKRLYIRTGVGETTIENIDGQLDVSVAASRLRVAHVRGAVNLETGSGGVEVVDVTGDVRLDIGSGGASLDGVRGGTLSMDIGSGSLRGRSIDVRELTADIGSGGVRLSAVKTPRLHLETGSGASEIELLSAVEDVSIEAGSGGVTLRLPASTGAVVDIETGSGGIDTDFDVRVQRMERRALRGTMGDGRGRIRIESGSGTVRLLKN